MLKQFGIVAFGLVVVATSSSAFAQQAQRPLTRAITVQAAAPAPVAAKPTAATRAIAIEEKVAAAPAAELTAEVKQEAPVVAEEVIPVDAPPVAEKPPVIVKEKAIVKVKPVERFAGHYGYGYSPRYAGGAQKCH
jgi:hypothetical protein